MELKAKRKTATVAAPVPGQQPPATPAAQTADAGAMEGFETNDGAEAAAGVLNAIDEDTEGGEEAELPGEFEVEEDEEE